MQPQLLLRCLAIFHVALAADKRCRINVRNAIAPLLVNSTKPPTYVYPEPSDPENVVLARDERILVACPARTNRASSENVSPGELAVKGKPIRSSSEEIRCVDKQSFEIQGKSVNFADISCPRSSHNAILRESTESCSRGTRFEIGYDLGDGLGFLRTISLCHDVAKARTLWARSIIVPVNRRSRSTARLASGFKSASLYKGMSMGAKGPYELAQAYEKLKKLIGDDGHVDEYISPEPKARKFLAKGHLIARADLVYASEQESTYFYANAVPMWQAINANPGNWFRAEEYARLLSETKGRRLRVYAGGLGTLRIEGKDFHLYGVSKIPVPKLLFKCLLDDVAREGLCLLVVNNPYVGMDEVEDDYVVCERNQACGDLKSTAGDTKLGYLYCCDVGEFYEAARDELGLEELAAVKGYGQMRLEKMKIEG